MSQPVKKETPENQGGIQSLLASIVLVVSFAVVLSLLLSGLPAPTPATQIADASTPEITEVAVVATPEPTEEPTVAPTEVAALYTEAQISEGQRIYQSTCLACHGMGARGVPGVGKDLIDSDFSLALTDEELLQFIIVGRQPWDEGNTTGIGMPARGGNPMTTDDQIRSIIAYLRTTQIQEGFHPISEGGSASTGGEITATESPQTEVPQTDAGQTTGAAVATIQPFTPIIDTGSDTIGIIAEMPFNAANSYALSCAGCHVAAGEETESMTLLGGDLAELDLVADAEALFTFLTEIQPFAADGSFVHPIRGESPTLTDAQIRELIEYIQSLNN